MIVLPKQEPIDSSSSFKNKEIGNSNLPCREQTVQQSHDIGNPRELLCRSFNNDPSECYPVLIKNKR